MLLLIIVSCNAPTPAPESSSTTFPEGDWIDLSYTYDENTIFWPTADSFQLDTVFDGIADGGYYYSAFQFCLAEHGGTHVDAPVHFAQGRWAVHEIPLKNCMGEAVVIDVSAKALPNPDYQIDVVDVENWEVEHGKIPDDAMIFFKTGYGQYWPDRGKYMGTAERGPAAVPKLHFPAVHPNLAKWLVENRKIKAVGLDTPSLDYGQSKLYETHQILYKENILGFENLANLDELPAKGTYIIALPMKVKGGSGGPTRVIALVQ